MPLARACVFPTPVGVFPCRRPVLEHELRLPHARGGVSVLPGRSSPEWGASPRPWGCFRQCRSAGPAYRVFPTPVGVFPRCMLSVLLRDGLPHARGGVSWYRTFCKDLPKSSPRPWGCFSSTVRLPHPTTVFPTPVGVFLDAAVGGKGSVRLPHARGGVSTSLAIMMMTKLSSPRPWGCFFPPLSCAGGFLVFPTPVGVFLFAGHAPCEGLCLPHARGGVSMPPPGTGA